MRSLDTDVASPKSNTASVLSWMHSLVVHSPAKNQCTLHVYGTPLCIIPVHLVKSSILQYIAREGNYWHTVSPCQKESSKTMIRFFIGKPFGYCFQRAKKFNLITEITCPKHVSICSTAKLGKCLSPSVAAQWIRTVSLPTLHCCTYYPSPKLSRQINIKENGAIWKEIERARRTAVWARHWNHWKQDNGWGLTLRKHNECACRVSLVELWTGKHLLGMMGSLPLLTLPAT